VLWGHVAVVVPERSALSKVSEPRVLPSGAKSSQYDAPLSSRSRVGGSRRWRRTRTSNGGRSGSRVGVRVCVCACVCGRAPAG